MSNFNRCGVADGKKIRLDMDVCTGKADSDQVYALLDAVGSDDEEDLAMLMDDSDTEFFVVSDKSKELIISDEVGSETPHLGRAIQNVEATRLDAIVHTQPLQISNMGRTHTTEQQISVGMTYKTTPGLSLRKRKVEEAKEKGELSSKG